MRILLDTHIILWAVTNSEKLPKDIAEMIRSEDNEIYYSIASVWETAIKRAIRPDSMPISEKEFSGYCREAGYQLLPITEEHIFMLKTLKRPKHAPVHKDPFDRIMVA